MKEMGTRTRATIVSYFLKDLGTITKTPELAYVIKTAGHKK